MALPISDIIGILSDNLRLRGTVMPLSRKRSTRWAAGLDIPRGGETILYTGQMYQMMPAIETMSKMMGVFENTPITRFMGLGRRINRFLNISAFMSFSSSKKKKAFDRRLRTIAMLLRSAGVSFGYLYEKELYAGALVYDHGMTKTFSAHARRLHDLLVKHHVRRIITVDPHTTDILRSVVPRHVDEWDMEVKNYLEILAEKKPAVLHELSSAVTLHDSCIYARYENIIKEPRDLLAGAGLELKEQADSGAETQCCGGPIESLYPGRSEEIARKRIGQLLESGTGDVITMCPICLLSLQRAATDGTQVRDISEYLGEAYL